ncbi:hypothetical protein F751_1052 [Auxenochlorella protothecoides]|uniref:Uncharacterized protein n=1 Tax=Auxenochlorella protothecoides TaxID=3075 RepID=A0A087SCA2_AUXPR|nr:hypothetical protein F751_1052 [Auxenochlorella protothecoides]KFM23356.1 hypothetical protein F751_1052 [Auxenochlorella protothecoides]
MTEVDRASKRARGTGRRQRGCFAFPPVSETGPASKRCPEWTYPASEEHLIPTWRSW